MSGSICTWYSRVGPPKGFTSTMFGTDFNWLTTYQSFSAFSSITSYFGFVLLQRVEHDLPGGAVVRSQARVHAGRQRDMLQPVEHFLAGVEGGDVVVVNDGDDRQSCKRDGAQMGQMGDAVQFHLEGNGDLLFDFFGGMAGPLGDDLRVGIGDVGIRFNGQIVKRNDAPGKKNQRPTQHQQPIA